MAEHESALVDADVQTLIADLESAREERATVEDRIEAYGESDVEAVAEAYDTALELLERYVDTATGTGDFESYVAFRGDFGEFVEGLPEDFPKRDAFEAADEAVDKRRLSVSDFQAAQEALSPAGDVAGLLDERAAARDRLQEARREINQTLADLDDQVDHLEQLRELGEADLDAPVEKIREPVNRYDEAVTEAFQRFRREASAREVLDFVATTEAYPLVEFRAPPADLREYVEQAPAGDEPIPTLLEYADYSQSKLSHYVEDASAFRTAVPMHRTYLDRLDAEPLTVGWPAPPADRLRYLAAEIVPVVGRFADPDVVALARDVRALAEREDYERLRRAAVARDEITAEERERIERGEIETELEAAREARERLQAALDGE